MPAPRPLLRGAMLRPQSRPGLLARTLPASSPRLVLATEASSSLTRRPTSGTNRRRQPSAREATRGRPDLHLRGRALQICTATGLSPDEKVRDLTDPEITKLREYIDGSLQVEGDLRRERQQSIKRLQEIGAYRGLRHRRSLPVNGQRTKTNARTRKGPKKTVGRGKKAATKT